MESGTIAEPRPAERTSKHGLKPNAIGFAEGLVIALASTAPAYSLAAVIGGVVVLVGIQAPAVLLVSFVPMFLIAAAFYYMNRADPDCGTTFAWVSRAMGPWPGWIAGWAVCTTGILVIGSLADVAGRYLFLLFGWDSAAESRVTVTATAVAIIGLMTLLCILGTELSARFQMILIGAQVGALLLFAVVALVKVFGDGAPSGSIDPELSWFSPFAIDTTSALVSGLLIGVFIYWGWESAVNLTEETEDSTTSPGKAAIVSTVLLLVTYVSVTTAFIAFAGVEGVSAFEDDEGILGTIGADVLGSPLDKLLLLAIVTSGIASTQTTILPASRTVLSMARAKAMPSALGRVHEKFLTPHIATITIGAVAAVFYIAANSINENFLFDTLTALALMIAFYYSLSGLACVIYYRREITKSAKNFVLIGVAPFIGAVILGYLFVKASIDFADPEFSDLGEEWLGVGPPLVIGLGFLLLGVVLMVAWRLSGHGEDYFRRSGFEAVPPEIASGEVKLAADTAGAGRN